MTRSTTSLAVAGAAAALALLAAGCGGGGGSPQVASTASTSTASVQNGAVAFARCMRAHGIPGWTDPIGGGVFDKSKLRELPVSTTRIRALEEGPCNHLLPAVRGGSPAETAQQEHTKLVDGLSFARCMRSHGVSRFPDPTAQGDLSVEMVEAQGIDVHSSAVLRVVQKCLPASHGALTPAKVEEALNSSG
jgi:hypothetical protein